MRRKGADPVVGLDQLTSVDPKHWGGYCVWRVPSELEGRAEAKAAGRDSRRDPLWRASWLMLEGNFSGAEKILESPLFKGGRSPVPEILRGVLAFQRKDFAAAAASFGAGIGKDAGCPGLCVMRGQARFSLGDVHGAKEDFERAIRLDHDCKVAYYFILGCGDLPADEKGLAALDSAAAAFPREPWVYALRGELKRMPRLALYEEAVADLRRAVSLAPRKAWLRAFLGRALGNVGRAKEGLAEIDRAVSLDSRCAWARAWRGEALRKAGRTREALADFARAVRIDPRYMYSYAWRGGLLRKLGRHRAALADLDRALELHPWYDVAFSQRAGARLSLGVPGAVEDMTLAARLNPKHAWISGSGDAGPGEVRAILERLDAAVRRSPRCAWTRAWRGESRLKAGAEEGAFADFAKALKLDPELAWAWAWRGEALVRAGRFPEALADLDRATALDKTHARAWSWKGAALFRLGRLREAVAALDASLRLDPKSAWAFGWRGEVKLRSGDFAGAVADLDRALTLDRRYVEAFLWRGEAHRALGNLDAAMGDISRSLSLKADQPVAYVSRALVKEKRGDFLGEMLDFARALRLSPGLLDAATREKLRRDLLFEAGSALESGASSKTEEILAALFGFDPDCPEGRVLACEAKRRTGDAGALAELDKARARNEHGVWRYLVGGCGDWEALWREFSRGPEPLSRRRILGPEDYVRMRRALDALILPGIPVPAWAYRWRGEALLKAGDWRAGVDDLSRALARDGSDAKAWTWRGEGRYRLGDARGALSDFDRAARLSPRDAALIAWRGQLKLWLGRYKGAERDLDRALGLDPRNAWAHGWRGACRLLLGDLPGALPHLDKAVSLDARDLEARIWRAEARRRLGRPAEALADLDFVLELSPEQFWARINRFLSHRALGRGALARRDLELAARCGRMNFPGGRDLDASARAAERILEQARGNRTVPPKERS